ncbi:D-alanyl-lipoteichoic acid biosynthesis protein DltB [Vagococcus elongatus]|uniref:Teichoic acid D-alanyltransferase n=1 Tax=Vagococcus elongatus TaxID=180344 RepID=A0A430AP04_9ENTE|nr:D-alanyl-lipoteichoic acid biosynthesis protein DltB [Vagococcus elongatus]RSU09703.1 D-alanyl-lipoteichoic acid biosynthesis protein DltB [Vagococcus elongatus]
MSQWLSAFPFLTPYEKPFYFVILGILLLPSIFASLKGKRLGGYQAFLTLFFLWMSFGGPHRQQGFALIAYVVWQLLIAASYVRYRQTANRGSWFYLSIFLSLLPMILIKVLPLYTETQPLLYFLGYSYLTFKSVQVIMEIRDGLIKELRLRDYIQFLIFFPTISSGPIDRFRRFTAELHQPPSSEKYVELLGKGIHYIIIGCLYKFIIGYVLGSQLLPIIQDKAVNQGFLFLGSLGYMYTYSFYLFFDFAGYSLFAVGVSYLLGHETPINFNKPFISANIKEFWNRWHMSLSFWFRDYVYMRLMFTLIKKKVFKSRIVASNVGYFALFLIMGVWHGLTWYYIVYGLFHASLICLTDAWIRFKKKHKEKIPSNMATKGLSIFLTFHAVCFSLLIFSGYFDTLLKLFFTYNI